MFGRQRFRVAQMFPYAGSFAGSIDPARIGVSGISAGAGAATGAAGGIEASGVPADPRIKAMVVYEPSLDYSLDDASRIAIPYLIMGGSQSQCGLAIPALIAETVLALPRIYVLNPSATHFSYLTGMCAENRPNAGSRARWPIQGSPNR